MTAWREVFPNVRDRAALEAAYADAQRTCGVLHPVILDDAYKAAVAELNAMTMAYEVKVRDPYPLQSERVYLVSGTYEDAVKVAQTKHKRARRRTRVCLRGQPYTLIALA